MLEGLVSGLPVVASHTRAVLSSLAVTTRVPSGLERGAPHPFLMLAEFMAGLRPLDDAGASAAR
jgi:hypothetical protein